ncbi:hypothetical protein LguiB_007110 [Lonicera macranthoides]
MEMKLLIPSPAVDFNFDSTSNSPYATAPSSPQRFGTNYFFSAPTSPTRSSPFFHHFSTPSEIPFNWEEKPGIPKTTTSPNELSDTDFAFDFSGQLERPSLSADELFDDGKIKPLKPPPRFHYSDSPKSPKSPKKMFKEAFSPRHKKKEIDPFSAAIEQTRRERPIEEDQRGRERNHNPSNSGVKDKESRTSRSLSPLRASDMLFEPEINQQTSKQSSSGSTWYNKWKLKDLLLFRSASEGSERNKKYALLKKSESDDVKNSSFRSTESSGGGSRRRVSAHELHYTANRAVSEEMRRKTFLPYKRGLLGCLGFNYPGVNEISRGIGSSILTRERD